MPTTITIDDLTTGDKASGTGVFDVMMRATKEHIVDEYTQGRIKGPEYSAVYLGGLESAMASALEFLMGKDKLSLELEILAVEKDKALAEKDLINAQIAKVTAEIALINSQKLNADEERNVLIAQECKLRAEYDLIMAQVPKVAAEIGLINQRKVTEQAQTSGVGVSEDSVLGRQIRLYGAQADGFVRDAEQKAAKIMIDSWSIRRSTNEATEANTTNKLDDTSIGQAVSKLLAGVTTP